MKIKNLLFSAFLFASGITQAQETFPVNGVHDQRHTTHVFINADLIVSPQKRLDSATLIIKDKRIR